MRQLMLCLQRGEAKSTGNVYWIRTYVCASFCFSYNCFTIHNQTIWKLLRCNKKDSLQCATLLDSPNLRLVCHQRVLSGIRLAMGLDKKPALPGGAGLPWSGSAPRRPIQKSSDRVRFRAKPSPPQSWSLTFSESSFHAGRPREGQLAHLNASPSAQLPQPDLRSPPAAACASPSSSSARPHEQSLQALRTPPTEVPQS